MRTVCCEQCGRAMYRVDGVKLMAPTDKEDSMAVPPITVTIKDRIRIFCSKACMLRWAVAQPEAALLGGGYPLW
jgi:hypothetical protein